MISIIMAAYNAEKTIELAIESVLNQTYSNFELLVINDCSKDRTAKLVEAFSAKDNRVRLISNEKNCGVSFTREHGLEEAKGAWIAVLDSDDAWAPEKLEKQIELQNRTNLLFGYTGVEQLGADIIIDVERTVPLGSRHIAENQLGQLLLLGVVPDAQDVVDAGI